MKTSNKLLIAFAGALILIPVLGMVIVSATQYKTGSYSDSVNAVLKAENFSTPTENMTSIAISSAFESVNVEDGKKMGIYINIIKDEKFGIKVPNELKDSIDFNVDANGQLQITFKNKPTENNRLYNTIWVYAPNVKQVAIANADGAYLDAKMDSLTLNVRKSGSINLQNDLELKVLNVNTEEVKNFYISKIDVKSLNVKLNSTDFTTENNSYENLSINSAGKSEISIKGDAYDAKKGYRIKNLFLNILDKGNVKIEDIKVDNCAGKLSDETTVLMPAVNLNQMYKK